MAGRLFSRALAAVIAVVVTQAAGQAGPAARTSAAEVQAAVRATIALPPPKAGRARALVVLMADNAGTETTDLIVPFGVIREADVADAVVVATAAGPVALMPALRIAPDMTMTQFDAAHPAGADVLVVPAMHEDDNPALVAFVRAQADKGAVIVSICEGAWIAARAGVFDGRQAATHWYAFDRIAGQFPRAIWVRDRRFVVDGPVMSTTGVSASIPASLALVEALAGHDVAAATARRLGVETWDAQHSSSMFVLTASRVARIAGNWLAFWRHETFDIPLAEGVDEIALALSADAWSRTYMSRVVATHGSSAVRSRRGLQLLSDGISAPGHPVLMLPAAAPAAALDLALKDIAARYGEPTADVVALQLETPRSGLETASGSEGAHGSTVGTARLPGAAVPAE